MAGIHLLKTNILTKGINTAIENVGKQRVSLKLFLQLFLADRFFPEINSAYKPLDLGKVPGRSLAVT